MVGVEGFEPPTLWSQTRCATRLRYTPTLLLRATRCDYSDEYEGLKISGRSRGIRTPDPLVPNQMRYQTALYSDTNFR